MPDLEFARKFAETVHAKHPRKNVELQRFAFVQLQEEPGRCQHRAGSSEETQFH